jgi:hypothetical protein
MRLHIDFDTRSLGVGSKPLCGSRARQDKTVIPKFGSPVNPERVKHHLFLGAFEGRTMQFAQLSQPCNTGNISGTQCGAAYRTAA